MSDEFMTAPELADYLRLKTNTIYKKVQRGELPFHKVGRAVRFKKTEIDNWLETRRPVDGRLTQQLENNELVIADLLSICGIGHSGRGDLAQHHDQYLYARKLK